MKSPIRFFAGLALALIWSGAVYAAPTPDTYTDPGGTNHPAAVFQILTHDTVTNAQCIAGSSATCPLGALSGGQSGAVTAGVGAFEDGADLTQGATTDAACAGDNTSGCSVEARLERLAQRITSLITLMGAAPAQQTGAAVTANAGTNLNTSALATDSHLTSLTSANHTDLGAVVTALGSVSLTLDPTVHISTSTTTTIGTTGSGLRSISVNSKGTIASAVTPKCDGVALAIIDSLSLTGTWVYNAACAGALTVVTTGTVAPDVTVTYH